MPEIQEVHTFVGLPKQVAHSGAQAIVFSLKLTLAFSRFVHESTVYTGETRLRALIGAGCTGSIAWLTN